MKFPTPDDVVTVHEQVIEEGGGSHGVLHLGSAHAAIERCRWGPFPGEGDLAMRAALLLRGIAQDHPFADGNKRTAFLAADLFARKNGSSIEAGPEDLITFMLDVAQGRLGPEEIAGWLRPRLQTVKEEE